VNPTRDDLANALCLDGFDEDAARDEMGARPRPRDPSRPWREGAVLILFYPEKDGLRLVLTRRTDTVEHHRAQLSFPGGRREEGEELLETALRETREEIGVPEDAIEVLGELPPFRIPPSGFIVHPFVGLLETKPEYRPDPREVASVHEVPLPVLLDPGVRAEEEAEILGLPARVPYFNVPDLGRPPLWGATAMMLSGFLGRVRAVLNGGGS
jgi:8-oxo-dGTP pyrophosphatase MutT (NUDIX family)